MIDRILETTRRSVDARMKERSLDELKSAVKPATRSLAKALKLSRDALILECKKASPSQGVIRPNFDIADIVRAYEPFADAISVLTNEFFFDGRFEYLREARERTDKPLLCKDFILTPYQVYEARFYDADAILLMMSLLDDTDFRSCFDVATSLNMDVLVEIHDEQELARALKLGAQIIGVNNRDFRTLKVDLAVAERLLPLIPNDKITVFESGVSTHEQLCNYADITDAFLIGSSLMKQPNLTRAVRELVFGRIKVCGLTRHEDALIAYSSGAVFGGFIFAPESPRCVSLSQAQNIKKGCKLDFVGVFVNQPASLVADYAKQLELCAVQLHGEENAAFISELRAALPVTCEIWKAIRVKELIPAASEFGCDRILLDAYDPERRGGTGQRFAWEKLNSLNPKEQYILSGGLSRANAKEAGTHGLWALDVNSGVESAPGVKNLDLLQAFFEELR